MPPLKKSFETTLVRDGSLCFIPVIFDPRPIFGKLRAPVLVTLNGYTYPSTIASMGNGPCIPLRRSHREAAGLEGNETLRVTLELDKAERKVEPPPDLVRALKATDRTWQRWQELSYSHQREHVDAIEGAKKPETRVRRIQIALATLAVKPVGKARAKQPAKKKTVEPARPNAGRGLNAKWHARHPMPEKVSTEQRLAWHLAHEKNCGCRPMPAKLRALLR